MAANIQLEIGLENGQFKVAAREVQQTLGGLNGSFKGFGASGAAGIGRLTSAFGSLKGLIAGAGIAGAAAAVYNLGKNALSAAASFEMNTTAFSTMLKSADKAKSLLSDLSKWTAKTPLEMEDAVVGAKRLLAFGVAQEDIIPTLNNLGNAAGGNAETLDRLTLAYGKLQAKGKASLEEINMFTEAGVPLMDALGESIGVSKDELFKMISDGQIGFEDVKAAIEDLTTGTGQFAGMMEKQSATLSGMWSTFKDNLSLAALSIGNDMLPRFKELLDTLSNSQVVLPAIISLFRLLGNVISFFVGAINAAIQGVESIAQKIQAKNLAGEVKSLQSQLESLQKTQEKMKKGTDEWKSYGEAIRQTKIKLLEAQIATEKYHKSAILENRDMKSWKTQMDEQLLKRQQNIILLGKETNATEAQKQNRLGLIKAYDQGIIRLGDHLNKTKEEITLSEERIAALEKEKAALENLDGTEANVTISYQQSPTGSGSTGGGSAAASASGSSDKKKSGIGGDDWNLAGSYLSQTSSVMSSISSLLDEQLAQDLERIELRKEAKLAALAEEYEAEVAAIQNSTMSNEEKMAALTNAENTYQASKAAAETKAEKEKRKIQRKAAKDQKTIKTFEIVVNTASAIMSAYSQLGPIGGTIFAAIIAALGAAQIALVQSEPLPALATGVVAIPQDTVAQLHAGETVVPKPFTDSIMDGEMSLGGGAGVNVYVTGDVYDFNGLLSRVESGLNARAKAMGAKVYTLSGAY